MQVRVHAQRHEVRLRAHPPCQHACAVCQTDKLDARPPCIVRQRQRSSFTMPTQNSVSMQTYIVRVDADIAMPACDPRPRPRASGPNHPHRMPRSLARSVPPSSRHTAPHRTSASPDKDAVAPEPEPRTAGSSIGSHSGPHVRQLAASCRNTQRSRNTIVTVAHRNIAAAAKLGGPFTYPPESFLPRSNENRERDGEDPPPPPAALRA